MSSDIGDRERMGEMIEISVINNVINNMNVSRRYLSQIFEQFTVKSPNGYNFLMLFALS